MRRSRFYRIPDEIPQPGNILVLGFLSIFAGGLLGFNVFLHWILTNFGFSFRNIHCNFSLVLIVKWNTDISLRCIPKYDAPQ